MPDVDQLIENARRAQMQWEKASQKKIDEAVRAIGKTVYDNADYLAKLTVDETHVGNYEDNVRQDKRKACIIWHSLKGKKSAGIIRRDKKSGLVEMAKPVGVVAAVLPMTIPVTNFMSNAMFSLKARNALVAAPHPRSRKTVAETVRLVLEALNKFDVPESLIQSLGEPTIELTVELMSKADVVVATGGMPMVKSAYSSGKPAYGVGPGNVQCIIDREMDPDDVVPKIVDGRAFNNGLPCACEQAVLIHHEDEERMLRAFNQYNAFLIETPSVAKKLAGLLYIDGVLNRDCMGITAVELAGKLGIPVPAKTRMLLVRGNPEDCQDSLRREKLCPVTILYTYSRFEEAVAIAKSNILIQGAGHSVAIHSNDQKHIEQLALAMPVTRVIVNQCATTSAGGSFLNGFGATTTLGTGFWGNTALRGNLNYTDLLNYTRIGYLPGGATIPKDEEIWS